MRNTISSLLRDLRGLDPLKQLFWVEFNYDRANEPVSAHGWDDAERASLADDPLIFAEHDMFKIVYIHLRGDLNHAAERVIVNRLLISYPYALFIFSDQAQHRWNFVNVKYERDASRRVFRRLTVEAGSEHMRTAAARLEMLDLESISRDLLGIPALAIQQRHDLAFDVESLKREFFFDYNKLLKRMESQIDLPDERRRLFIQKLFNRLLCIVFLECKGWLTFNGRKDYLRALWEDYQLVREEHAQTSFYWDRLYHLFFNGLNSPQNLTQSNSDSHVKTIIGDVPYLNGGLFEREEDDDNRSISVADEVFDAAIVDLFYHYNFTVIEATPVDLEVAIDPEMLGRIFEEVVTGRHETGSYYTPKLVVAFMCREGIKGYLRTTLPTEMQDAIARFVDEDDATELHNPASVLPALQDMTVCDPACGSGAYLLGMLQELLRLRTLLFAVQQVDILSMYDRKLEIIQRNLYGVDKDPLAVDTARLRLWLSLIVDFKQGRDGVEPPTLLNLDYKIRVGDSLLGQDPSRELQLDMFRQEQIHQYFTYKKQYLKAYGSEKYRLRADINRLRDEISLQIHGNIDVAAFDWSVEFAEVFVNGGFNVVLSNPPYGEITNEITSEQKHTLKSIYGPFHSNTTDLYTYFYARGIQILRSGGTLVFISSNKWLRSERDSNLRRLLSTSLRLETVVDFGELPVFEGATHSAIIIAQKQSPTNKSVRVLTMRTLERLDELRDVIDDEGIDIDIDRLSSTIWSFGNDAMYARIQTMRATSRTLADYLQQPIYRGLVTGFNEAFIINGSTRAALIQEDQASDNIIKPLVTGRDIRRWTISEKDKWIILTPIGVEIHRYPAVFDYLQQWQTELERRSDKGDYWWELRACDYYDVFSQHKIMFPDITREMRFTLDRSGVFCNNTAYFIPSDDLYLLGVLNSTVVEQFYIEISPKIGSNYSRMSRQYVEQIPIPLASAGAQNSIADLVQECLEKRGVGCEVQEKEIDSQVRKLYGLKSDEAKL